MYRELHPVSSGDVHMIKFGPGANDTAWVHIAALDLLHDVLHASETHSRANLLTLASHPLLVGTDARFIEALAFGEHLGCGPGYMDLSEAVMPAINEPGPVVPLELAMGTGNVGVATTFPTPNPADYPELTNMFAQVDGAGLIATVSTLSNNFTTRYYRSTVGRNSALWIQDQFATAVGMDNVVLVENSFDQPNVIAAIPAAVGSTNEEVVVFGAHLDSINQSNTTGRAPGADDDASGIAIILQALQILQASGYKGQRRIEFHAYAGEEGAGGKVVRAMMQLDMVGYITATTPEIWIMNDTAVDAGWVTFTKGIISAYIPEATVRTGTCGYSCSDHCRQPGLIIEGNSSNGLNPYYHSINDTLDKIDMGKATIYVKAVLAFALEASERGTTATDSPNSYATRHAWWFWQSANSFGNDAIYAILITMLAITQLS
ncbi:Zn-dependent exopeptidase [Auriculariales sp. MPI-PUGE-AT-0066]|nr:Zn-dependent exopeptidase [Auriculariales sp. MPI-PUGE-AT-0066]